jgi:uracil-DNA glycosylase family 4
MSALSELSLQIQNCQRCVLHKSRTRAVPGEGAEDTTILFVGEAPGWHEDQQGKPFVGPAGQFLEELLASIGLKRQQVFIANVLKCRPPGNRDPLPGEIQSCWPWLERQIELLHPKMIVSLGRYSMARFFPEGSISKLHGTAQRRDSVIYYAMYHPAAALHQQKLRQTIKEDMLKIPKLLAEAEKPVEIEKQPEQLSLF